MYPVANAIIIPLIVSPIWLDIIFTSREINDIKILALGVVCGYVAGFVVCLSSSRRSTKTSGE